MVVSTEEVRGALEKRNERGSSVARPRWRKGRRKESRDDSPGASRRRPRAHGRPLCIPGRRGWRRREGEEDEAGECRVTFYGSTGPVPPLMFSNFTCGRAPGIQGPRDTYVISCVDCHDCDWWEGG